MDLAVIGANPWFMEAMRAISDRAEPFRLALAPDTLEAFFESAEARRVEIAILACQTPVEEAPRLIGWARRHNPGLRVVVKFAQSRPELVHRAIQAGVWGCFTAEDPPETLLSVLSSVRRGRVSFPFVDFQRLNADPFESLTRREVEVLKALAQGWTNQQISTRLGISPNTVKYHLKLIYDKLGVANRSTAVAQYVARTQG